MQVEVEPSGAFQENLASYSNCGKRETERETREKKERDEIGTNLPMTLSYPGLSSKLKHTGGTGGG